MSLPGRHRIFQQVFLLLLPGLFFPVSGRADDWPNWGGPHHDGKSRETGFADAWPKEGLPLEWTHELGVGFSSMSVVGNRLLSMGHKDGMETVWCLNSRTGEVLWTHEYPSELIPNLHEGGPCSTPTVDGDRVYTVGKEGQLFCLNFDDGKVVWQKELQTELGVKLPEWGFSSSPLILGKQMILEGGRLVSFDKFTGEKLWQTEIHEAGYGSAAAFEHQGKTLLAALDCDGLRVVDSADGTETAFAEWKSPYKTNATTPIVVGDQIFVSTGYNIGCGLFQLKDDKLVAAYSNTDMCNHFNNSVLWNGYVYGFDGNSHNGRNATLNCVELATGKLAWKQRGAGCGSVLIADNKLIVLAERGDLIMAAVDSGEFKELGRSLFLEGRCWTVPVLANGRVYGRNADGKLACVSLPRSN
jgi:outer membrane protein assembly factor BamB